MAIDFPNNPAPNALFIAAGKQFKWNGYVWRRFSEYAIIDAGLSTTEVSAGDYYDGGSAS